eukprot:1403074-Amphidinium_carterae.4
MHKARSTLKDLRSRCSSTIELSCRLMVDEDLLRCNRLVAAVGESQHMLYHSLTQTVRSMEAWRAHRDGWMQRSFMTELRPLFTVEGLLKGLLRVGVKFSEDELQHLHAGCRL